MPRAIPATITTTVAEQFPVTLPMLRERQIAEERRLVESALGYHGLNIDRTARALGVQPSSLRRTIRKLGLQEWLHGQRG